MAQTPVSVKLTFPQIANMTGRPGVVQILQTNALSRQDIVAQSAPTYKAFVSTRPLITNATPMAAVNTNTAVQYVRKAPEMTVLSPGGPYVTASLGQQFAPFGAPIFTLNPSMAQPLSSSTGLTSGPINQIATGGSLSNLTNSRKPCNCTKSHCLKLYCECFAQGQLCQNCHCHNCMNNLAYEEERGRAIKMTLERNPTAFHPKIGRGEGERKHTKGCNCKRSGCLKNYCECYEAKISCSDLCRCQGCRNTEDSVERRSLMRLAAMGTLRSRQPSSYKKLLSKPHPDTLPHAFFTWEVIEATAGCLLAQAEEAERRDLAPAAQERIVLEEFGRILERVMDSASKAHIRTAASIQDGDSDGEQPLIRTPVSGMQPEFSRITSSRAIGAATASAAAADVLLRDDEEEDDDMMGIGEEHENMDDDIFDDDTDIDSGRPLRRNARRQNMMRSSRTRVTALLNAGLVSDDDSDVPSKQDAGPTYRSSMVTRNKASIENRYHTRNLRHSPASRGHDPDSMI